MRFKIMNLKKLYKYRYNTTTTTTNPKRKGTRVVRLGKDAKRSWRIRSLPKFRVKSLSPLTQWKNKFKSAFKGMMMMVNFTGCGGNAAVASSRKISDGGGDDRVELLAYDKNEYENRMMYEIYKSLVASIELNSKYRQRMCV